MPDETAAKKKNDDDDDEEDEDEDYNPEEEVADGDDDGDAAVGMMETEVIGIPGCTLSISKRKAVDTAFEELFGYRFGNRFVQNNKRLKHDDSSSNDDRMHTILSNLFGATAATQLLATSESVRKTTNSIQRVPMPVSAAPTTITEVKHYAGKKITIQRKVAAANSSVSAAGGGQSQTTSNNTTAAQAAPPQGLDSLLEELNGPGKLSTVAKTSADWDSFKTEAGVENDLEKQAQGKNAFLQKQDFLQRVDQRRFVQEKEQRNQDRSKRGK